jgi:hypothetical protein
VQWEDAGQVDGDDALPLVHGIVGDGRRRPGHARVVDERVDAPEAREHRGGHALGRGGIGHVDRHRERALEPGGGVLRGSEIDVCDRHARALGEEARDHRAPQAAGPSRDDHDAHAPPSYEVECGFTFAPPSR